MKKVIIGVLIAFAAATVLESCSSKLCPAYGSYPQANR
jgi:type IV secretory pathway VirB2 component (pilin)